MLKDVVGGFLEYNKVVKKAACSHNPDLFSSWTLAFFKEVVLSFSLLKLMLSSWVYFLSLFSEEVCRLLNNLP